MKRHVLDAREVCAAPGLSANQIAYTFLEDTPPVTLRLLFRFVVISHWISRQTTSDHFRRDVCGPGEAPVLGGGRGDHPTVLGLTVRPESDVPLYLFEFLNLPRKSRLVALFFFVCSRA